MEKDLVSIQLPVYNGMPYIKRAVKSLLDQTYKNWECIIVDDGSTDNTKEFLDNITDKRFRVFHFKKNKGRPYARQKALDEARGEYLAMLDADDFYHPKKLEIQVLFLKQHSDISLVSAGLCSFGEDTEIIRTRGKGVNKKIFHKVNNKPNVVHAVSMLRMEVAKYYRYNLTLQLGQDMDYLTRCLKGKYYVVLDQILYYYSEFDSVSIKKIKKTYLYHIKKDLKSRKYSNVIIFFMKYLISSIIYPILGQEYILKKRGHELSYQELSEFKKLKEKYERSK